MLGFNPKSMSTETVEKTAESAPTKLMELVPYLFSANKIRRLFSKKVPHAAQEAATHVVDLADDIAAQFPSAESKIQEPLSIEDAVSNIAEKTAAFKQQLKGGLADDKSPKDFNKKDLKQGEKVELEHTPDKDMATEISMDHLVEHPEYYKELKKMEKGLEKDSSFIGLGKLAAFKPKKTKIIHVSSVAVLKGDKMLWGRRRDSNKWTTPGGHIEKGEDALTAAVRELEEESGIKLAKSKFKAVVTKTVINEEGKKLMIHGYLAKVSEDTNTSMTDDPDQEVHRWHWVKITDGELPEHVINQLHAPENVLLKPLGIKEPVTKKLEKKASVKKGEPHIIVIKKSEGDTEWYCCIKDKTGKRVLEKDLSEKDGMSFLNKYRSEDALDFLDDGHHYALNEKGMEKVAGVKDWDFVALTKKNIKEKQKDITEDEVEEKYKELLSKCTRVKTAGGPGSGVSADNTAKIDMPLTEYITIGKRTAFMNSKKPFLKNKTIKMKKIKFVGQEKYVPKKLNKFMEAANNKETWMFEKAIDGTVDKNGDYAVLDGHHRFLLCKRLEKEDIKANIYTVNDADREETLIEKVAFNLNLLKNIGPSITKAPGIISDAFRSGQAGAKAKDMAKGTYNLMLGGKTINNKWDPLYGAKSLGRARDQHTSGPLKGMYKYTDTGEHALDMNKKRDWTGFMKDEFSGASRTRGDLAAKQMAKQKGQNVGQYLSKATTAEKANLQNINQMKVQDFIKKHPKLAANYYGRNVVQKGFTVGFPAMALNDLRTGASNQADPNSSNLGNTLGSLAEAGGWAATGPLGLLGATGVVTGLKGGAKMLGNAISRPKQVSNPNFEMPYMPSQRIYDSVSRGQF